MATSQNGYPALRSDQTRKWKIPVGKGPARHFVLAPGAPGFVLAHFAAWFDRYVEDINEENTWDDWGYANRDIRGGSSLSNHASGTAEDINATKHPLSRVGTFSPAQEKRIRRALRRKYGGVIRWGGDYSGRKDEMHFEINAPRKKVERVARRLRFTPTGRRIRKMNP